MIWRIVNVVFARIMTNDFFLTGTITTWGRIKGIFFSGVPETNPCHAHLRLKNDDGLGSKS